MNIPSTPGFAFLNLRADPAALGPDATTTDEAQAIFDEIEASLAGRGLGIEDLVKLRFLYTSRSDFPEMNAARDPLFRSRFKTLNFPASTGVVTGGRGGVRPRLEMEVIASSGRQAFCVEGIVQEWAGVRPPFSHGTTAQEILFVSGQGPYDADGGLLTDDAVGQIEHTLDVLERVLAGGGAAPSDILGTVIYLKPAAMAERDQIRSMVMEFAQAGQASAKPLIVVPVEDLAFPGLHIEIDLFARNPRAASSSAKYVGAATASALSARQGDFVFATATGEDVASALLSLAEAKAGVEAADAKGITTIWIGSAAQADIDPGTAVDGIIVQPQAAGGDDPVIIEFVGSPSVEEGIK
jgi:2-iminobutanoate/2-iminopropanoate deaminase